MTCLQAGHTRAREHWAPCCRSCFKVGCGVPQPGQGHMHALSWDVSWSGAMRVKQPLQVIWPLQRAACACCFLFKTQARQPLHRYHSFRPSPSTNCNLQLSKTSSALTVISGSFTFSSTSLAVAPEDRKSCCVTVIRRSAVKASFTSCSPLLSQARVDKRAFNNTTFVALPPAGTSEATFAPATPHSSALLSEAAQSVKSSLSLSSRTFCTVGVEARLSGLRQKNWSSSMSLTVASLACGACTPSSPALLFWPSIRASPRRPRRTAPRRRDCMAASARRSSNDAGGFVSEACSDASPARGAGLSSSSANSLSVSS